MAEIKVQPRSPILRPADSATTLELERMIRTSMAAQSYSAGDIWYAQNSTNLKTLAIGAANKLMYTTGSAPAWTTSTWPTGAATAGDIVYASAANTISLLAIGGAGQVLGITAGLPAWQTPSTYLAHNLLSATHSDTTANSPISGDLIYATNPASWTRLAISATVGALLMSDGSLPGWATTLTGTYTFSAAGTAVTVTNNLQAGGIGIGVAPTAGALSIGAHGQAVAANDIAAGSSSTNYLFWDDSAGKAKLSTAGTAAWVANTTGATNFCGYVVERSGTEQWFIGISSTDNFIIRNNASTNYLTIVDATGATTIAQWLNLGTTTLAAAQGDAAFGIGNTSGYMFYDQSGNSLELRSAGDASVLLTSVAGSGRQWQIVSGGGGGFTSGDFVIYNASAGGRAITVKQAATQNDVIVITNTELVVNDGGLAAMDFRVEGDTLTHLLFVDANANTNGAVGINQSAITTGFILDVVGDVRVSSGFNCGGSTAPADGSGIFTTKLAIGQTTEATNALDVTGKGYFTGEVEIDGAFNHDGTTVGFYGVAPATRPSAYAITGDATDRAYDAPTVAVAELANVVATVIRDLTTQGLLQTS